MSVQVGQKIKHQQHGVGIVKSIDGDKATVDFETGLDKASEHEKGINKPKAMSAAHAASPEIKNVGTSEAGHFVGTKTDEGSSKRIHSRVLSELKQMPKPNLPKSELAQGAAPQTGDTAEMVKDDMPHEPNSPEDKAHDVVEEGEHIKHALAILDTPEKQKQMLEHLRSLVEQSDLRSPENEEAGKAPKEKKEEKPEEKVEEIAKSEEGKMYTPREVAIAILKKAEKMGKEWQTSKPEKILKDSVLSEKREVVNPNDIIEEASQAMTNKSPLRLKAWVEKRKVKNG